MSKHMSVEEFKNLKSKGSKYHNLKTEYNGEMYDSKKEADYARHLQYLKHAKDMKDKVVQIERQVPYNIIVGPHRKIVAVYFADFRITYGDLRQEVVDVKPLDKKTGKFLRTSTYSLKKKLVEEIHQIKIIEA